MGKEIFPCEHVVKAWGEVGCGCDPQELIASLKKDQEENEREYQGKDKEDEGKEVDKENDSNVVSGSVGKGDEKGL